MDLDELIDRIGDMELTDFIVIAVALIIAYFLITLILGVFKGKSLANNINSDDEYRPVIVTGTVIEKIIDNKSEEAGVVKFDYTIEWLIIEDNYGNRRRYRNVKSKEILITSGDKGEFLVRGETIYGFTRQP